MSPNRASGNMSRKYREIPHRRVGDSKQLRSDAATSVEGKEICRGTDRLHNFAQLIPPRLRPIHSKGLDPLNLEYPQQ